MLRNATHARQQLPSVNLLQAPPHGGNGGRELPPKHGPRGTHEHGSGGDPSIADDRTEPGEFREHDRSTDGKLAKTWKLLNRLLSGLNAASNTIDQHSFVANSAGTAKSKYAKGSANP
mmetsp:Transcript_46253/g.54049  ORF Transcript_46253/g.54049 Transcript_46253/m.54049 type:complete len:118 (-) Transcript_46253:98-451(-)